MSRCKVEEFALTHGMSPEDVRFLAEVDALQSNKVNGAYNRFAGCLVDRGQPPINASMLVGLDDLPSGVRPVDVRSADARLRRVTHGGKEVSATSVCVPQPEVPLDVHSSTGRTLTPLLPRVYPSPLFLPASSIPC